MITFSALRLGWNAFYFARIIANRTKKVNIYDIFLVYSYILLMPQSFAQQNIQNGRSDASQIFHP